MTIDNDKNYVYLTYAVYRMIPCGGAFGRKDQPPFDILVKIINLDQNMARMLSLEASTIRGSIGGRTYLANQFHQIVVRQRTAPVNPNTSYQTMIRSSFASASVLWEQIGDDLRQGWQDYADSLVYQGPLGPYSLPGRQVFLSNIAFVQYLNYRTGIPPAFFLTPPEAPGFCAINNIYTDALVGDGTGFSVNFTNAETSPVFVGVWRSRSFSVARKRFKGPFLAHTLLVTAAAPGGPGHVDFPGLVNGAVYFATLRAMTTPAGHRISTDSFVRAVAQVTG